MSSMFADTCKISDIREVAAEEPSFSFYTSRLGIRNSKILSSGSVSRGVEAPDIFTEFGKLCSLVYLPMIDDQDTEPLYIGLLCTGAYQDAVSGYEMECQQQGRSNLPVYRHVLKVLKDLGLGLGRLVEFLLFTDSDCMPGATLVAGKYYKLSDKQ
ncbi:unnamed protein product [Bathycoccus prasinos]